MKNFAKFISTLSLFLFITNNTFAHSPGGVSVCLKAWHNADGGTTLSSRIFSTWNEPSGNIFNTTQGSYTGPKLINTSGNSRNCIGGGGSGAGQAGVLSPFKSGSGADGEVILANTSTPTITAISANICAGGFITITGTNLTTATIVTIGGTAVSSITSKTGTQIIAVVNTACTGYVQVTTSGGTATSAGTFASNAIPDAPTVTTPLNYCLSAVASQLTATGSNLTLGNTFPKTTAVVANNRGSANYSWLDANVAAGYNYYRIRSIDKNGQINYTKIVKIWIGQMKAAIAVYPNPIANGVINLQLTNQPAGVYGIRLLNSLGQIIVSKEISHTEGSSTVSIQYSHQLSKGIYQLEVTKPDGTVEVEKVVN